MLVAVALTQLPSVGLAWVALVCVIEAQSMCPTVEHMHAIISHHMCCWCGWSVWHWCWRWTGSNVDGIIGTMFNQGVSEVKLCKSHSMIGTMIPELSCHKLAKVLLVFVGEMLVEFNEHLIGYWLNSPCVTGSGEHTSHLKHD